MRRERISWNETREIKEKHFIHPKFTKVNTEKKKIKVPKFSLENHSCDNVTPELLLAHLPVFFRTPIRLLFHLGNHIGNYKG